MATDVATESPSEALQRHIEEHRQLAAELRERFGDPSASMGAFLRDRFGPDAFLLRRQEPDDDRSSWLDEEEPEEDGR